VACEECRALIAHEFRSADDLINALRVAAEEAGRGVLEPLGEGASPGTAEREALHSALDSGALPRSVRYRFRCTTCQETFALEADVHAGTGRWLRGKDFP
jgi:hypothetical protein